MTTWIPGMRTTNRVRIVSVHSDGYVEGYWEDEGWLVQVGADAEPDLEDAATRALVTREPVGMRDVQARIAEWQGEQFPHATLEGAAAHLSRELDEAAEELADCFFLSSQCERLGGMPVALPEACWSAIASIGLSPASVILAKLAKNRTRQWPTTPDGEGVYEALDAKDEDKK